VGGSGDKVERKALMTPEAVVEAGLEERIRLFLQPEHLAALGGDIRAIPDLHAPIANRAAESRLTIVTKKLVVATKADADALAAVPQVSPKEWGARVNYDLTHWTPWIADGWALHHGGGPNPAGDAPFTIAKEMAVLRAWEAFHIDVRKWRGIAYNYAIGQTGTLYRLRGEQANGAHYSNDDVDQDGFSDNYEKRAVVLIMGEGQIMSEAMKATFSSFWAESPNTWGVWGHGEIAASGGHSTSCPGVGPQAWIDAEGYKEGGVVVWPTLLRKGDKHPMVRVLRGMLYSLDHLQATGDVNNGHNFSPTVDAGVRSFQGDAGVAVDGVVGPVTRAAIYAALERTK
jgi:hypothetical protein